MSSVIKTSKKFIPHNKNLTRKARENRKNPSMAEKKIWYDDSKVKINKKKRDRFNEIEAENINES